MKNLSDTQTDLTVRCVPSEKGERITPPEKTFRRRPEIQFQSPKYRAKIQWMIEDFDSFHAALLRKFSLGSLPKRAAKYACADFDLEDEREYCGDDGEAVTGNLLAGVTAYIVRCARDPIDYLFSLKNVPAQMIEPIKTYLRVKLAMGRLAAEIERAKAARQKYNRSVISAFAQQTSKTSPEQANVEGRLRLMSLSKTQSKAICLEQRPCADEVPHGVRDDNVGVSSPKPAPAFKYHTSPAKTYGFKEMTAQYGYDPRDTSVYWIEKRANALRWKWKKHGQALRGETAALKPNTVERNSMDLQDDDNPSEPVTKYFQPADADYNSVWPPVQLPDSPPKAEAVEPPTEDTGVRETVTAEAAQEPVALLNACSDDFSLDDMSVYGASTGDSTGSWESTLAQAERGNAAVSNLMDAKQSALNLRAVPSAARDGHNLPALINARAPP